jgi:predicted acylesterase/phospholipase RssA
MTLKGARLFGGLSAEQRATVEEAAERRRYAAGEILCHKGDVGRACQVIISGGVLVQLDRPQTGLAQAVFLGPGQVVGELSLLSDSPATATVVAAVDTEVYVIPRRTFLDLVEREAELSDALFELLIQRMRHREAGGGLAVETPCTLLVAPRDSSACDGLCEALVGGVAHYAPGSVFIDVRESDVDGAVAPTPEDALRCPAPTARSSRIVTSGGPAWCARLVEEWRAAGGAGRVLGILLATAPSRDLVERLRPGDLVLLLDAQDTDRGPGDSRTHYGLARVDRVVIGNGRQPDPDGSWCFRVPADEVEDREALATEPWDAARQPTVDWLARRITGREVGLALGAGAAGGFAYLGVLQVLEEAGIAVDYLCGSSMGGVLALTYSKAGSARIAIQMGRELVASNHRLRDLSWRPRSALLRGAKRAGVARKVLGDSTFAQLGRPTAVVAADLVTGERVVLETGSTAEAWLATSAIPGVFPPQSHEGRILVDGAVVSRVPTDLLDRRRCGLRIAVNVVPSTRTTRADEWRLEGVFDRFLGLAHVVASSWGLLAGCQGAAEARQADILVEPVQERYTGFDFGTFEAKIEAGRTAAVERLDMIRDAVARLLRPGAP